MDASEKEYQLNFQCFPIALIEKIMEDLFVLLLFFPLMTFLGWLLFGALMYSTKPNLHPDKTSIESRSFPNLLCYPLVFIVLRLLFRSYELPITALILMSAVFFLIAFSIPWIRKKSEEIDARWLSSSTFSLILRTGLMFETEIFSKPQTIRKSIIKFVTTFTCIYIFLKGCELIYTKGSSCYLDSIMVCFYTIMILYMDLRSRFVNYPELQIEGPWATWEELSLKLQLKKNVVLWQSPKPRPSPPFYLCSIPYSRANATYLQKKGVRRIYEKAFESVRQSATHIVLAVGGLATYEAFNLGKRERERRLIEIGVTAVKSYELTVKALDAMERKNLLDSCIEETTETLRGLETKRQILPNPRIFLAEIKRAGDSIGTVDAKIAALKVVQNDQLIYSKDLGAAILQFKTDATCNRIVGEYVAEHFYDVNPPMVAKVSEGAMERLEELPRPVSIEAIHGACKSSLEEEVFKNSILNFIKSFLC